MVHLRIWQDIDTKLDELAAAMQRGFREQRQDTDQLARAVAGGLAHLEGRLDGVDPRIDGIDHRLASRERRLGRGEQALDEVQETLTAVAKAVDADAETPINYGQRIDAVEARTV